MPILRPFKLAALEALSDQEIVVQWVMLGRPLHLQKPYVSRMALAQDVLLLGIQLDCGAKVLVPEGQVDGKAAFSVEDAPAGRVFDLDRSYQDLTERAAGLAFLAATLILKESGRAQN